MSILILLCILVGCGPTEVEQRAETVEFLTDQGAQILPDDQGQVTSLHWRGAVFNDDLTDRIATLTSLTYLGLSDSNITADQIGGLSSLVELQKLLLSNTQLSDAAVPHMRSFQQLSVLDLSGTAISDTAIADLLQLQGIGHLDVSRTAITRIGLTRLHRELPNCRITPPLKETFDE